MITCYHEEIAVAMDGGYYLATGRPQVTLVHNIVGLQHASQAIYEAWLNNTPMFIYGEGPIVDPEEIGPALAKGLKVVRDEGRLALIDTVTQPR